MNKIRKNLVSRHTAFVYETICREQMWALNAAGSWPFHFAQIGRYWDASVEIDIAALDPEENNLILGECKYWQEPAGVNILRELEQKALHVDWRNGRRHVWYVLFCSGGFTAELQELAAVRPDVLLQSS